MDSNLALHRIVAVYKRKAKSDAANFGGVHLIAQLSKVVKRILGRMFLREFSGNDSLRIQLVVGIEMLWLCLCYVGCEVWKVET